MQEEEVEEEEMNLASQHKDRYVVRVTWDGPLCLALVFEVTQRRRLFCLPRTGDHMIDPVRRVRKGKVT